MDPNAALAGVVLLTLALVYFWGGARRAAEHQRNLRALYALSVDLMAAGPPAEMLRRLLVALPRIAGASSARIYLHKPASGALERVPSSADPDPLAVPVNATAGAIQANCALCFRNRTLLAISDMRRSPFFQPEEMEMPQAAIFIPMLAQEDLLGVLEIDYARRGLTFEPDERSAAQHLANQIATAMRLQEQHSMREQLLRSEKLAAAGQLISSAAGQLRSPLDAISRRAEDLLGRAAGGAGAAELAVIAGEARHASNIISRLLALARAGEEEPRPVEINALLASLLGSRQAEQKAGDLETQYLPCSEPLTILGGKHQIEQVFLNLILYAERSAEDPKPAAILVSTMLQLHRARVEIAGDGRLAEESPFVLDVCRAIAQSHGGDLQWQSHAGGGWHFVLELPLAPAGATTAPTDARRGDPRTALVVDFDESARKRLLVLLSGRGHRVVPARNADEAADLVQRFPFEMVFCSNRQPGSTWIELFERVRRRGGAFVLMTEPGDHDVARALPAEDGCLLRKPVTQEDLNRVLDAVESLAPAAR